MLKFLTIFTVIFVVFQEVEARQYEEVYLFDIIESNDCENVGDFFDSHTNYVKKTKHIIEFVEAFRKEMGVRFGYVPTWEELYESYKNNMANISLPKEEKKRVKNILKTIAKKTEKKELGFVRCNAVTFDYRGDLDVDERISEPVAVGTSEALAGLLLCLIDNPVTRGVGSFLLAHSASRFWTYYTDVKSKEFEHSPFDAEGHGLDHDSDRGCGSSDHYDRLTDSEIR
ncbi:hypothetical protein [Simkania sp.]|uniref:hypothetical protein n=1 Tax=Simkania sp. TaxID=34094 RepID=UPI003B51EC6B